MLPKKSAIERAATRDNLRQLLAQAFTPRRRPDIVAWAEKNITEIPYSPLRGRFRVANSPFLAPILRAIVAPENRRILLLACVQSGKTLAPEIALSYLVANAPGPAMWLDIVDDSAKDQSEGRLQPLFENCPPVKAVLPISKERRKKRAVQFDNGMTLWIGGANNKGNLQRRSIRYIFGDETWLWKKDRMREAEARTSAFGVRGKCVFMSQGSFTDDDTDRLWQESDQREWTVRCPHCGRAQPLVWERLRWDPSAKKEDGTWDIRRAAAGAGYVCEGCGRTLVNSPATRNALNASGEFVPQNPNSRPGTVAFRWNALATMDWAELVTEFLTARRMQKRGDKEALQVFFQKRMALPWGRETYDDDDFGFLFQATDGEGFRIGEQWADEAVVPRTPKKWMPFSEFAKTYGAAERPFARLRFLTVDVQLDHYFWCVRAWDRKGNSRLFNRGLTMSLAEIEEIRQRCEVAPQCVFVDCGYRTERIKSFCAKFGWTALKGNARTEWTHRTSPATTVVRPFSPPVNFFAANGTRGRQFLFSSDSMKDVLDALRRGKTEMKWELPVDVGKTYVRHLTAEYYDFTTRRWLCRAKKPNHWWDCESMQICAAMMAGIVGAVTELGALSTVDASPEAAEAAEELAALEKSAATAEKT